ncbi:MAG: hypothetical protein ACRD43_14140, partial [Pyrinomonadaceae bacterium]
AQAVFLAMDGKASAASKEEDEVFKRINDSKDKLQQAIWEAESATTAKKTFADSLWQYASEIATEQKKFQIAVDCVLKMWANEKEAESNDKKTQGDNPQGFSFAVARDHMLLDQILPKALKEKDLDSSEYAVNRIQDNDLRSTGILKVAAKYLELGNKAQSYESMQDALKLLEKGDETTHRVRITLSSIPIAMGIEKSNAFETVSLAIRMANHLPTPNPEDKLGTEARIKYVDGVLMPNAYNLEKAFKILAKSDVGFAASIAQEIQPKSWRLVADIVVETERLYPLDKQPKRIEQTPKSSN